MFRKMPAKNLFSSTEHQLVSMLWRADTRPVDELFQVGFSPAKSGHSSLVVHVAGEPSAYVSFGKNKQAAIPFMRLKGWMCVTNLPEIFVDVSASVAFDGEEGALFAAYGQYENEVVSVGALAAADIYQARQWAEVDGIIGHTFAGALYTNPAYAGKRPWAIEILSKCPQEAATFQAKLREKKGIREDERFMSFDEAMRVAEACRQEFKGIKVPLNFPVKAIGPIPEALSGDKVVDYTLNFYGERVKGKRMSRVERAFFGRKSPEWRGEVEIGDGVQNRFNL